MRLVIKGSYLFDKANDVVLMPHFTGEYNIVDCTEYKREEELRELYDDSFIKENKENFVVVEGEKYFYAEYSPIYLHDGITLLSDLSEMNYIEEKIDF